MTNPLRSRLEVLFVDAIGTDEYVADADLIDAGVPQRRARNIARATRRLTNAADARAAAEEVAMSIESDKAQEAATSTNPADLAARVPRW